MSDHLAKWSADFWKGPSITFPCTIVVEGIVDLHLGPRWQKARIKVTLQPSSAFDVRFSPGLSSEAQELGYTEAAIFGLLDILLVSKSAPIRNVIIILLELEIDPIDSSWQAFRMAGRDAASKALVEAFGNASVQH